MRLPRLYRLIRISKFIKLLSAAKTKGAILSKIKDYLSFRTSSMRLIVAFFTVVIFAHIVACLWYFTALLDNFGPDTWVARKGYVDEDIGTVYMASLYWSITTMSTVGYGDIAAVTEVEMILSILWMTTGVVFFSFVIGSLSSMIANFDSKESALNQKLSFIDEFAKASNIEKDLVLRLRAAI